MTGLSDVERMRTSSRNPMVVNQHMILNSLKGYEKHYFIGGSLSWGNVRGVISNVDGLHIHEEQQYVNSPHNDVWGISDIHLANEVNDVLKKETEPFFAFVQLSGNHSPNTIPSENFGFTEIATMEKQKLIDYSFNGALNELNGQRFLDYSVKHLITLAKKEFYFDNTIFIFVGDHGLPRKAKHIHSAEQRFSTHTVHTPLVIYAPKLIKAKKIDYPVSEVDIMATIAGLSGQTYINTTMGRDILDKGFDKKEHYAFYMTHENNPRINLIGKEYIFRIRANGDNPQLFYYYFNGDNPQNIKNKYPNIAKNMENICRGIYESTRYIRFHNSSKQVKKYIEKNIKIKE
jgi:phosphoglycerol transferase MdoB-like AlkP superfamily enzyme